jgi:hypothetical protein
MLFSSSTGAEFNLSINYQAEDEALERRANLELGGNLEAKTANRLAGIVA